EGRRLAAKVNADGFVDTYLRPYLHGARDVLDVGCGPEVIACAVARAGRQTRVVGLDVSEDRLAEAARNSARLPNRTVRHGTAPRLPFESGVFDLAYCRFLLEYLPEREAAVAEMARVCRPGSRVLLQDLDGQLVWHYPPDEELQGDLERVLGWLGRTGF